MGITNTSDGNKQETRLTPSSSGYTKLTNTNTYTTGASETSVVIYIGYNSSAGSSWVEIDDVALN